MYDLALDDETQTLNKKYGYNNTVAVLKAKDFEGFSVLMILHVKMSYFAPNGRARLGTKRDYRVVVTSQDTRSTSFDKYHIKAKAEASKYFSGLIKSFKVKA